MALPPVAQTEVSYALLLAAPLLLWSMTSAFDALLGYVDHLGDVNELDPRPTRRLSVLTLGSIDGPPTGPADQVGLALRE